VIFARLLITLAIAFPAFAGNIVRSPSADGGATCNRGSSSACTFTVTCAAALCTRGEADQYQTVLNEAWLGDTIQLEAGRTFPATGPNGFHHPYKNKGSGYVTVTTTQKAKIPDEGTRITPAYNPLLPTIQAAWISSFAAPAVTFQTGTPHAAEHYRFVGVRFASVPMNLSRGLVTVGTYNGFAQPFTATAGSPELIIGELTGEFPWLDQTVQLTSTGTLPAPLQPDTYYTVKNPNSASSKLQLANASGNIITITAPGSGTHRLHEAGVKSFDDQPNDIVFDRCIFQGGFTDNTMSRLLALHARKVDVLNSFFEGGRSGGSDAQAIAGWNGKGPYLIHNNYVDGTTENIMFGGATPFVDDTVQGAEIRYNYLPHPEERWRVVKWSPRLKVLAGRVVQAAGSTRLFMSTTSGFTGTLEPSWPTTTSQTVTDADIVWKCWTENGSGCTSGGNPWTIKNNFELKSSSNIHVHHNVFDQMWVDAQETQINLKNENRGPGTATCVPPYSGRVDTTSDGTTHLVIARPGTKLPRLIVPATIGGVNPYSIIINGTPYTIVTGSLNQGDSEQRLPLTTSAGNQTDVSFSYGQKLCHAAWFQNILFENNILRNSPQALKASIQPNGRWDRQGNVTIRNNLAYGVNRARWSTITGGFGSATSLVSLSNVQRNFHFEHNTLIGVRHSIGIMLEGASGAGDGYMLSNIWSRGKEGVLQGVRGDVGGHEGKAVNYALCGGATCPPARWDRNIIAGVNRSTYPNYTTSTFNRCNNTTGTTVCDPEVALEYEDPAIGPQGKPNGRLFVNYRGEDYRIADPKQDRFQTAKRGGSDGRDIGVDYSQLAMLRNFQILATDREALFTYDVTAPMKDIACVVEVSRSVDLSIPVPDLDPTRYTRPDTDRHSSSTLDGSRRTIRVGKNEPLTPNTEYYYRLQCAGDATLGSFRTAAVKSGVKTIRLNRKAPPSVASILVEYSYDYDRETDTLLTPATATGDCVSQSCTITIESDSGRVMYYRFADRDADGNILRRSTVHTTAVR
jgi:hypothetical protein